MPPRPVYGVDFSGAKDAGRKLWVAGARRVEGALVLDSLLPGAALPGSGVDRASCLQAVARLVGAERGAAFGFDFPFALPAAVVGAEPWEAFAAAFPDRYDSPEAFRAACRAATGGQESKRETDRLARVPFNAFNLRVYRQTYYGLREVIAPLVRTQRAAVLPMQPPAEDRAWVLEICPASTLKRLGLYYTAAGRPWSYKGQTEAHEAARARLWQALVDRYGLRAGPRARRAAIADAGGDALDAVIAACATAEAIESPLALPDSCRAAAPVEGYIYF